MATIEAIYENGVFKPLTKTSFKEHQKYKVIVDEDLSDVLMLNKPHPVLGKIVFHEDPTAPLDEEDWPEDSR